MPNIQNFAEFLNDCDQYPTRSLVDDGAAKSRDFSTHNDTMAVPPKIPHIGST
jgi:hypothetical protein